MAEAVIGPVSGNSLWYQVRAFLNAKLVHIFAGGLFTLLAIFLIYPIAAILIKSFWGDEGFTFDFYVEFFSYNFYYWSLINTLILGTSVMLMLVIVGFCFAYLTTRGPQWLRKPLKIIALLPLAAPPYIFAISLITLLGRNGFINNFFDLDLNIYSWAGVITAQCLAFLPLSFMMIENVLNSFNPSLEETASDMGASEVRIVRSITIPLAAPGLLKAALLVFVMTIAEFGNPAILGGRIPFLAPDTYLMITGEGDFNMASVLSVVLITPCILIFFLHNYVLKGKGYATITGKGMAAEPKPMALAIKIPFLIISVPVATMVLLSFGVILIGSFVKIVGVDNTFVVDHVMNTQSNIAIWNSVKVSLGAGGVGAIVGTLLAYVIMRGKFRGRQIMEMTALSGFALPGTVIGVGYIIAFNRPPFLLTGTIWIIILNCVFRFLAVGVEAGISKLHQISIEIEEASADLGADFITIFFKVVLPIMFSAFVAGFIYTFMTTMMSLSSVIFLTTPGFDLASVYIYLTAQLGELGLASATTIKMIAIVAISFGLLQFVAKKTGLDVRTKQGA
ncbi:MAG: iron ABC transporter permease [Desulfobacterales bacterium]|jgi:iron(III) transport system permease protein|nr:iron ABC transporter permease [Desulfobacterales bacterium]MDP6682829.1 iron ABC transporter permease [Desulfobacterales bacterium]MDP6807808.1 iron ABC transporter permease [Desulfobacterales bacterium]|tara:strand:+ start:22209 stop:23897 length:1689 start_codon:yes stop_codon:yes gene_type:complete